VARKLLARKLLARKLLARKLLARILSRPEGAGIADVDA
jgi:hypothetical protein